MISGWDAPKTAHFAKIMVNEYPNSGRVVRPASGGWPAAKIAPVRQSALVQRDRLISRLSYALDSGRNTLVVAPGGAGKTALLSSWTATTTHSVAWYALDAADRDPRRLLAGLCAAIDYALPGKTGEAQQILERGGLEVTVLNLLLAALDTETLTLVVDDFHHLDGAAEAGALFEHVLRFRPAGLTLAILSRTIPALGLTSLTALDAIAGLGQQELAFTLSEVQQLLQAHGVEQVHAAECLQRSGGWAAGALLLGRIGSSGLQLFKGPGEPLLDRLGAEVMKALPATLRRFLLESAALGPVTGEAADAILERDDCAARFAEAQTYGLFLEENRGSYRYHDLFAEYLTGVFRAEDPAAYARIIQAAATYWVDYGDRPQALALLAGAAQWQALARLLEESQSWLWARGLWSTALAHIQRLPSRYRGGRLQTLAGYIHGMRGEHTEALAYAERGIAAAADEAQWVNSAVLAIQSLALSGRYSEALDRLPVARERAERAGRPGAMDRLLQARGFCRVRLGQVSEGKLDMVAVLDHALDKGQPEAAAQSRIQVALALIEAGYADEGRTYLEEAARYWQSQGNEAMQAPVANGRALLHLLTGDLDTAIDHAEAAIRYATSASYPMFEAEAYATLAEVLAEAGRNHQALEAAARALTLADQLGSMATRNAALRAQISVALARYERATVRQRIDHAMPLGTTPVDTIRLNLAEGELALRNRAYRSAAELLRNVAEQSTALEQPHLAGRAFLLLAEAELALTHVVKAEQAANRASALALASGCEGYLLPLAPVVPTLLEQRRGLRQVTRAARQMLNRLAGTVPAPAVATTGDTLVLTLLPFGQGSAHLGAQPIDLVALRAKARELLFFAAHADDDLPRDVLLDALWSQETAPLQSFWNAGRDLRRVFGDHCWFPQAGLYRLRIPVVDLSRRAEALIGVALSSGQKRELIAAAEEALALMRDGPYLAWCDSPWAIATRTRLTEAASAAAQAASRAYFSLGNRDAALHRAREAMHLDPLAEGPRRLLLQQLRALGLVREARGVYDEYRVLLHEEVGAAPPKDMRALVSG